MDTLRRVLFAGGVLAAGAVLTIGAGSADAATDSQHWIGSCHIADPWGGPDRQQVMRADTSYVESPDKPVLWVAGLDQNPLRQVLRYAGGADITWTNTTNGRTGTAHARTSDDTANWGAPLETGAGHVDFTVTQHLSAAVIFPLNTKESTCSGSGFVVPG